ncbi:MAG: hypothetical protein DME19_04380 [Verrucomicrobia bacterium]|nr:MAG: hypothetical protein DME19_04380 [Verrucomicrobiota bacterium]
MLFVRKNAVRKDASPLFKSEPLISPTSKPTTILPISQPTKEYPSINWGELRFRISVLVLKIGGIGMSFIGLVMSIKGCEEDRDGTYLSQSAHVVQYGFGFVLMALSMILSALIRLIQNRRGNSD